MRGFVFLVTEGTGHFYTLCCECVQNVRSELIKHF